MPAAASVFDRLGAAYRALRGLDAAGSTRRWRDIPQPRAEASYVSAGAGIVAARAAAFVLNNSTGARIAQVLPDQLVGTGIVPRPAHPVEAVRTALARSFSAWVDQADADGRCDFFGIQLGLVRDMVVLGEGLGICTADAATGTPQLRRLHPEQLDRSKTIRLDSGRLINQGVEFDAFGRIAAYWIRPSLAGDALAGLALPAERWPASDVIHMFKPLFAGQVRGLSWLAPVLMPAKSVESLIDAMLQRAKVAAMHAAFITMPDGEPLPYDGEQTGTELDVGWDPGAMVVLRPGEDVKFAEPPDAGNVPAFASSMLRMIAAATGMAFEQLSGDYSQVNYSSARAALLEFRRFAGSIQHQVIVFQMCRPVWRRFLLWQVLSGRISAGAFQSGQDDFMAVKWLPPKWDWVDPMKDAQAAILEIDNRLTSRSQVVAERGYDIEELDREIAADQARLEKLNIAPVPKSAPAPTVPVEAPANADS
ncbi:MAG: phage portal protein [Mesorhizobium sp.]|uniref:phage portal protein n=1 Tax=Mesorhizobium sp. TaxID=1871066 RepID=UPI000FE58C3C|nr:phage portal protein [Mesorhizobium sp.]RWB09015.1 MAG: phage portal protein [Mesorhizobium sp.]RWB17436.1 MAG: phage portal protein [Mesorhizobium sp.]